MSEHPFLSGNYGPVTAEITASDLATDGAVPAELQRVYLRIGPNPYTPPEGPYR